MMANMAVHDAVHKLQLALLEGIETEKQLLAAGSLMSRDDYNDVVTERSIADLCGYPLCQNSLPPADSGERKGRYRISLKEHKVYDVQEMYMYCSTNCLVNSKAFSGSLNEERCNVLNPKKLEEVLGLFDCSKVEEDVDSKIMNMFDGLKVKENEETKAAGEVKAGPSDAIEGYVPQPRLKNKFSVKMKEGVGAKTNKSISNKDSFFSEMDFMSTIITNDEYSISKMPCGSTKISSNLKLEAPKGKEGGRNFGDQCATSGSSGFMEDDTRTTSRESTGKTIIVAKDELGAQEMPSASVPPQTGFEISAIKAEKESHVEKESISGAIMLKSSLKSSGSKKVGCTVTWADEKINSSGSRDLCEVRDIGGVNGNADNDDDMLRLASAEACAMALGEAAETVASGDYDVVDAVSEAGIVILPRPHEVDEGKSMDDTDALDSEAVPIKWPNKPGIPRSDMFDPEDSWYDAPPEGFSLTLSPFATMWTAIFSWITSSSLAYIYGRDESFHEEYLSVNGREYPRKIVLEDGRSSEIMQTLSGCLSRALPGLATDLRLPTPVSTLEKGVERLLSTMSFIDPVPAFRIKQWQVIALLFIDALSVCKIPALTPHMMNRTMLIRKVLDGAHISSEQYEAMKDFIIPLGRAPHFSSQSGA